MASKVRVDVALVQRGLCPSRERAQAEIMAGMVYIREKKVLKASETVTEEDELILRGAVNPFVSRGGFKLDKAIRVFNADVKGVIAMDIGAATGGFTDVLLQNGASHVYAIDVGYGQLDWKIRNDPRVTVMERTNARLLTNDDVPLNPKVTVMDVSFISIKLILPVAAQIMGPEGIFYTLIKPQFEAGKEKVGKKGVVRDPAVHEEVIRSILEFAPSFSYKVTGLDFSPITGPEGNIEFLARIEHESAARDAVSADIIPGILKNAYATFGRG